jgi:hemoglobin
MKKILFGTLLLISLIHASETQSLYKRLGGYDAIAAVSKDFHLRLKKDPQLGRFWAHRGIDGMERELQLLINFICSRTGGPSYYLGRSMSASHIGMKINGSDWQIFMKHLQDTLNRFKIHKKEQQEVLQFVESLKSSIVES